jgi:hypothetical protein
MRGSYLMAVEAALHDREANLHPLATECVAWFASEGRVLFGCPNDGLRVHSMGESKVRSRRAGRWRPVYSLLHAAVMTLGTVLRLRPQGGTSQGHTGVAAGAAGKERTVLPMIERILRLSETIVKQACQRQYRSE